VQIRTVERSQPVNAQEPEADSDFVFQKLKDSNQARLSRGGQSETLEPHDPHGVRAQRDGFGNVGSAQAPPVKDDCRPAFHRGDDLGKQLDGAATMIELAATMV
jgi:hypothetical protein